MNWRGCHSGIPRYWIKARLPPAPCRETVHLARVALDLILREVPHARSFFRNSGEPCHRCGVGFSLPDLESRWRVSLNLREVRIGARVSRSGTPSTSTA